MSSNSLLGDPIAILTEQQLAFASTLRGLKGKHFCGRLVAKSAQEVMWNFYVYYGRILFASGGTHPVRQWLALIQQHTDNLQRQQILRSLKSPSTQSPVQCWEYEILHENLKQGSISRQQLTNISQTAIIWSTFDIWQSGEIQTQLIEEEAKLPTTILIDPEQASDAAESEWSSWREASILAYRPNMGIKVVQPDILQKQTPPAVYRTMMAMMDGNSTVREIAAKFKKDVKQFIRTLTPFVQNGILTWSEISDLPCPVKVAAPPDDATPQASEEVLTIACIDDSRAICEYMKMLATDAGYNYISITDPLQAMDILLDRKPDLIFLDLVMPNTNGYEICTQLRHQECFKNVPIIILTGNDGIIDRVRAKLSGSTDFLGKPLSASRFETVIQTYLVPKNTA